MLNAVQLQVMNWVGTLQDWWMPVRGGTCSRRWGRATQHSVFGTTVYASLPEACGWSKPSTVDCRGSARGWGGSRWIRCGEEGRRIASEVRSHRQYRVRVRQSCGPVPYLASCLSSPDSRSCRNSRPCALSFAVLVLLGLEFKEAGDGKRRTTGKPCPRSREHEERTRLARCP